MLFRATDCFCCIFKPLDEEIKLASLKEEFEKPYFKELSHFVDKAYAQSECFPPKNQVFLAFDACPFDQVKVVVIGQDPYHGAEQAHGLSFSVRDPHRCPPSLKNIYRELADDLTMPILRQGDLSDWASQGVLLLNTVLTVREGAPGSHRGRGWERFTDSIIARVNDQLTPVVFMLWGAQAQRKASMIDTTRHCVLTAAHPSPLSAYRGFFGCRHFSLANTFLKAHDRGVIDWSLPDVHR